MKKYVCARQLALGLSLGPVLSAQIVQAPMAQQLVTSVMSAHPELRKLGLHATPPGSSDEVIVASNIPTKLRKKSSQADLEVERTRKPAAKVVTESGFYDIALPLADKEGRPIGMTVMEMNLANASSQDDAILKAQAIESGLERQIPNAQALYSEAPSPGPLTLLRSTPVPEITGDFDHFAIDEAGGRLFVSAEVHHSIEVFDLKTGEHLLSAPGVKTPHTIVYVPETKQLLVADGGDNSCVVLDGRDLHQVKRIPLEAYPDAGFYDPEKRIFYIGNGGKRANAAYSYISSVSAEELKEKGRIRVESANLEAMAIDRSTGMLYVNMRDKNQIGVVDLAKGEVRATWTIPGLNLNTPMQLDAANHRLFVAGRKPGKFFVIDATAGKLITTLDCVETADDMTYDPRDQRIYITGAGGVTVVKQSGPDSYRVLDQFGTNSGKTSVLVPSLHQFYIIHTKTLEDNAALQVYRVN